MTYLLCFRKKKKNDTQKYEANHLKWNQLNVYWFGLVGNGGGAPLRLGIGGRTRKGNGGGC